MRISTFSRSNAAIIATASAIFLSTHIAAQETRSSTSSSPSTSEPVPVPLASSPSSSPAPTELNFRKSVRTDLPLSPDQLPEKAAVPPPTSWKAESDFSAKMKVANAEWSERHTEIAKQLEKAGISLKQTSQPGVWIITSPLTAATQPAFAVRLFPEDATTAQMQRFKQRVAVPIQINFAMRFFIGASPDYPDTEQIPGTGETDNDARFLTRELLAQTGQALAALPSIKPIRAPTPIEDTPRMRHLRALLKDLKAQKIVADARRESFSLGGENSLDSNRRRANTWDEFCSKLGEVIEDTEKELRGEFPSPSLPQ